MRGFIWLFVGSLTAFLSSCSVYAPLTPATPLVTWANPVELRGTLSLQQISGAVAVAPLPHLTLHAAGVTNPPGKGGRLTIGSGSNAATYATSRQRQWEAAAGWHRTKLEGSTRWYVSALGGVGAGRDTRTFNDVSLFVIIPLVANVVQIEADYRRVFGQVYGIVQFEDSTGADVFGGGGVRVSRLFDQRITLKSPDPALLTSETAAQTRLPDLYLEPSFQLGARAKSFSLSNRSGLAIPLDSGAGLVVRKLNRTLLFSEVSVSFYPVELLRRR